MSVLRMEGVAKRYGVVQALDGVGVALAPGEVRALVGENGSGKSTLLRVLAGEVVPDAGAVAVAGAALPHGDALARLRAGVAVVPQEPRVCPQLDVAENVWLGCLPARRGIVRRRAMRARADAILAEMDVALPRVRTVGALAQDARHMVDVARAVGRARRVVAFDETTASLGADHVERVFGVIRRLRAAGAGCLFVSHRLPEVLEICDTITVLRDGRVAGELDAAGASEDELIRLMVGRDFEGFFAREPGRLGAPRLELRGLRVKGRPPVDLSVRAGEIVGVGGLVGSGRTSLLEAVYGCLPRSGEVRVDGVPLRSGVQAAIAAGVGLVPEDRRADGLALERSVAENMLLADAARRPLLARTRRRRELAAVAQEIGRLRLKAPGPDAPVRTLSGGNQQKVVLGRWLLAGASVLLLDEPTRGVDVGAKRELYRILDELAREGIAVLVVSSELPELIGLCDRILIMREGRPAGEFGHRPSEEQLAFAMAGSPPSHAPTPHRKERPWP